MSLAVALIADSRHPVAEPFAGGLEAHVWSLADTLTRRGHRVTLFAGPGSDPRIADHLHIPKRLQLSPAARADRSMVADEFMNSHHAYLEILLAIGSGRAGGFDVVHNHSLHYLPIAMARTIAFPMVTTLHTPPTPWLESAIAAGEPTGVTFVAVSEHTADAWRPVAGAVDVVYNGVDPARWPVGAGGDDLIWFGRITPEKGTHLAIAAARAAGRSLLVAGPISDRAYFRRSVEPHIGGTVTYLGHLYQAELAKQVARSAATLVTPTWDEPYGLVAAESMSCGTPVVAVRRGGLPELIDPTCGVVVEPDDIAALVAAIPQVTRLDRAHIARHAFDRWSIESMVSRYERVYEALAGPYR